MSLVGNDPDSEPERLLPPFPVLFLFHLFLFDSWLHAKIAPFAALAALDY
jgi:hypothetical protein